MEGKGVALLPTYNTEAINLHLIEIAEIVAPGALLLGPLRCAKRPQLSASLVELQFK